jgi:hypothetical protein
MTAILLPGHSRTFSWKSQVLSLFKRKDYSWALKAHACNPSHLGGRDPKDCSLKPVCVNSLWGPISKNPITKIHWWSGSRYRPWVQASEQKQKKKRKEGKITRKHYIWRQKSWTATLHFVCHVWARRTMSGSQGIPWGTQQYFYT